MVENFLMYQVQLTIKIFCDNMGEIFLSKNYEGKRTKYLDIRFHFVREYVKDGTFEVKFIPTLENKEDPFTKNPTHEIFSKNLEYLE